jgi:hypothetical protein
MISWQIQNPAALGGVLSQTSTECCALAKNALVRASRSKTSSNPTQRVCLTYVCRSVVFLHWTNVPRCAILHPLPQPMADTRTVFRAPSALSYLTARRNHDQVSRPLSARRYPHRRRRHRYHTLKRGPAFWRCSGTLEPGKPRRHPGAASGLRGSRV